MSTDTANVMGPSAPTLPSPDVVSAGGDAEASQRRRRALEALGIALHNAEARLQKAKQSMSEAQAWFYWRVPGDKSTGANALRASQDVVLPSAPQAAALAADLKACATLDGLHKTVQGLLENNQRLVFVVDLMLTAMDLVHAETESAANTCIRLHLQNCEQATSQVAVTLARFPESNRMFSPNVS